MNITIKNADWSAEGDNLGRLDVRTEPNETTQALLDVYGKTWTLEQQFAIEDFLTAKEGLSFNSKLKGIVLPIMNPSITNIADETQGDWFYDIISGTRLSTVYGAEYSGGMAITDNGIKNNQTTSNSNTAWGIDWGTDIITNISFTDIHAFAYYKKTNLVGTEKIIRTADGSGYGISFDEGILSIRTSANYQSLKVIEEDVNKISKGFRAISLIAAGGSNYISVDENGVTSTDFTDVVNETRSKNLNIMSKFTHVDDCEISAIGIGDGLTAAESLELKVLLDNLMDALWVD